MMTYKEVAARLLSLSGNAISFLAKRLDESFEPAEMLGSIAEIRAQPPSQPFHSWPAQQVMKIATVTLSSGEVTQTLCWTKSQEVWLIESGQVYEPILRGRWAPTTNQALGSLLTEFCTGEELRAEVSPDSVYNRIIGEIEERRKIHQEHVDRAVNLLVQFARHPHP